MKNEWILLSEPNLPEPYKLVWIKRKNGSVYIGYRRDRSLATNPDISQQCYWYGNQLFEAFLLNTSGNIEHHNNFSDLTVESWKEIDLPE